MWSLGEFFRRFGNIVLCDARGFSGHRRLRMPEFETESAA